jgi:spore germination cell wall hydrolase CwlJ-like protein
MKILRIASLLAMALLSLNTRANSDELSKSDLYCLAENIYHESRGEPIQGQFAVAQVTLNRVNSKKFQKTICEVVYAPKQFSWTNNKNIQILEAQAWLTSLVIAQVVVLTHSSTKPKFNATHFHTKQVNPYWNRKKKKVAVIGNHIFYASK